MSAPHRHPEPRHSRHSRHSRRHRRTLGAVAVASFALLPVLAGCGGDDAPSADPSTDTTVASASQNRPQSAAAALLPEPDPAQKLPPNDIGSLRRLYDPALASMGLRLTRGALIDLSNDGYEPSNTGTHLALYVEPIDDGYTNEQYVEGLYTVSALITPDVFARWSDLESYDICQEPPPSIDDRDEPLPYTQINLPRSVSDAFDWNNGDLVDLLVASKESPDFKLVVAKEIRQDPSYQIASDAANTKLSGSPN